MLDLAIGVDLGATKIATALIDRDGHSLDAQTDATNAADGPSAVLDRIAAQINALLQHAPRPVTGVGLGSPGQVDPISGAVRDAVNLSWREVHLATELRRRLTAGVPIWLQKDTNAGVIGEQMLGAGRNCSDFVYLTIGSGLGAGVIVNGALVNGATNSASELGHLSLDPVNGYVCTCGLKGCAETVVSGRGLIAVMREVLASGAYRSGLKDQSALTTTEILDAARSNDAAARAAIDRVANWLGQVMAVCVGVLNPERFVLGGGLGQAAFDLLVPGAKRELEQRVLAKGVQQLSIVRSQLASSAVGAACLVWSSQAPTRSEP